MIVYERQDGVPRFEAYELGAKQCRYCVLIPIINEGDRILQELKRAGHYNVMSCVDVVLCDGGSTDGSMEQKKLQRLGVNTLLIKRDDGRQGAQLRMGIWWALQRGYDGVITIGGNNKDSIEDIPGFIEKLDEGYDFIQGSRFLKGGHEINTPLIRLISVRLIHAPLISLTAGQRFTDTTNAYRAYSRRYLENPEVCPLRDIFVSYELLAYLSVRATQLGMKACEIPVTRRYPKGVKTPTKISLFKGNYELVKILIANLFGGYNP